MRSVRWAFSRSVRVWNTLPYSLLSRVTSSVGTCSCQAAWAGLAQTQDLGLRHVMRCGVARHVNPGAEGQTHVAFAGSCLACLPNGAGGLRSRP